MNSTQGNAFTDLANRITSIVIAGQQRDEIAQLVIGVNGPLKTAVAALRQVDGNYTGVLTSEFNQTDVYYRALIVAECARAMRSSRKLVDCTSAPASPILRDRIHEQRQRLVSQLTDINTYLKGANAYSMVLTDIESTHDKLYDAARRKLNMQDYAAILQQDVLPLYQDVEQLKGAH